MSSPRRRIEADVMKLMMTDHEVKMVEDTLFKLHVTFHGPKDSPYEGGVWRVNVQISDGYPYRSPSIGFLNKIFHPNIDEVSGSVCLDVINQTWSPMYDLVNVFEAFLPQLLMYPNPADPLNGEAAALLMNTPDDYKGRVREYVRRFATREAMDKATSERTEAQAAADDSDSSSVASLGGSDDEARGMEL